MRTSSFRAPVVQTGIAARSRTATLCAVGDPAAAAVDDAAAANDGSLTVETTRSMFADVRAHYRKTGAVEESQVCRNMLVTRVNDFANKISRCHVAPSEIHGDGLFANRDIAEGELVTFYPADALMVWEDGDRTGDMMIFFGAHIPQSERDGAVIASERAQQFELYVTPQLSAVGDPARRDDLS